MASNDATIKMIRSYNKHAGVTRLFTGMFQAPAQNFHNSEAVEFDIERGGEEIAIAITDISTGYNLNASDIYTNKTIKPPVFKEATELNVYDLLKRGFGQNTYADNNFQAKATTKALKETRVIENKIRRSIELQCAQVLQTGTVTLTNATGASVFTVDYKPKTAHFPTAGTAWSVAATATPIDDLEALSEIIRNNGLVDSNRLFFGIDAWNEFMRSDQVLALMDLKNYRVSDIPRTGTAGTKGATYRGSIDIGHYKFDMFTYGGRYTHPQTGLKTQYLDPGKVIMMSNDTRLDATFGGIPKFDNGKTVLSALPRRMRNRGGRSEVFTNTWVTDNGEHLFLGVSSRPLMIPTAIDTFGCLTT